MNESSSTPPPAPRVAVLLVDDQRLLREGRRDRTQQPCSPFATA